ncbi:hypothetical protein [Nocardia amikacinitolerans]|uniref:hypothetical protein n=1 Tax=Nocardia amikacinitolerans TaxID=756689 RepID=UPI00117CFC39|nr:hypothetical protein [Nocardia amikacinitolerans]
MNRGSLTGVATPADESEPGDFHQLRPLRAGVEIQTARPHPRRAPSTRPGHHTTTVLSLYTRVADPEAATDRSCPATRAALGRSKKIDLAAQIRQARAEGRKPPAGRLLGLPELPAGDVWVDIAGTEAVTGIPSRTITGWLARSGPKKAPFPAPHRFLYRLYWPLSTVEEWTCAYSG